MIDVSVCALLHKYKYEWRVSCVESCFVCDDRIVWCKLTEYLQRRFQLIFERPTVHFLIWLLSFSIWFNRIIIIIRVYLHCDSNVLRDHHFSWFNFVFISTVLQFLYILSNEQQWCWWWCDFRSSWRYKWQTIIAGDCGKKYIMCAITKNAYICAMHEAIDWHQGQQKVEKRKKTVSAIRSRAHATTIFPTNEFLFEKNISISNQKVLPSGTQLKSYFWIPKFWK